MHRKRLRDIAGEWGLRRGAPTRGHQGAIRAQQAAKAFQNCLIDRDDLLRPFSLSDPQANTALFAAAGFSDVKITLETRSSHFTSFDDDFWEPIGAGGGRLGQAYLALPEGARLAVRQDLLKRLPVRAPTEPISLEHSAWLIVGSG